jgi:hypothetical protein
MFFTRRKIQRDRDAGLTFEWRGSRSNTAGLLVALGLLGMFTAVIGSAVRIEVVAPAEVAERHAMVVVVPDGGDDGGLVALAEERSPHPSRFDPEVEWPVEPGAAEVLDVTRVLRPAYAPELTEVAEAQSAEDLAMVEAGVAVLPKRRPEPPAAPRPAATPVATLSARGELGGRLPAPLPNWEGGAAPEWLGRPLTFLVGVDPTGGVRHCMPLDESVEALDVQAEAWLGKLRFHPGSAAAVSAGPQVAAGLVWGVVEFRLQVMP